MPAPKISMRSSPSGEGTNNAVDPHHHSAALSSMMPMASVLMMKPSDREWPSIGRMPTRSSAIPRMPSSTPVPMMVTSNGICPLDEQREREQRAYRHPLAMGEIHRPVDDEGEVEANRDQREQAADGETLSVA